MTNPAARLPLRTLLAIDAVTCAAMGVLLIAASVPLGRLTDITAPLLFWAGAVLLPVAGFMAVCARLMPVPAWAASLVVLGNVAWVLASLVLPVLGIITPNPLGWLFLTAQAVVVAILAWLESAASRHIWTPA
ncbi:hypothetical protein EOI86_07960 [Hwanghaeella grinnelliae]|uniref:Integral membrane protein n=1 Tax=Hwanghaeella grinnelliae TaxID=2500179 RepID=A0A437QXK8_9PROT|nr:hypothetical protein [Hwanghaeella grinnelliae]RVU39173.1 hypothetical protein EOI86_07960 [Hwanghaeella grinnelliae]